MVLKTVQRLEKGESGLQTPLMIFLVLILMPTKMTSLVTMMELAMQKRLMDLASGLMAILIQLMA